MPNRLAAAGRRVGRLIAGVPVVVPPGDVAHEERHRLEVQRTFIKGLLAYIPIVGVLAVTANLLIQVRGNQGVALAIVANLPLSSLALIVAVNVSAYLIPSAVAALGITAQNYNYDATTRTACARAAVACAVVSIYVANPIVLAGCVVTVYAWWRLNRRRHAFVPTPVYFFDHIEPQDRQLLGLWREGRERRRLAGADVPKRDSEHQPLRTPPRDLSTILEDVHARSAVIAEASRLTAGNAAYGALMTAVGLYGFTVLTLPAQYAPLERLTVAESSTPLYGYVFSSSAGSGIFVPRSFQAVTPVAEMHITSQRLCTVPGFPATPLITAIPVPRDRETNTVACPAYPGKITPAVPRPAPVTSSASPPKTG